METLAQVSTQIFDNFKSPFVNRKDTTEERKLSIVLFKVMLEVIVYITQIRIDKTYKIL